MLHCSLCFSSRLCCLAHIHLERTGLSANSPWRNRIKCKNLKMPHIHLERIRLSANSPRKNKMQKIDIYLVSLNFQFGSTVIFQRMINRKYTIIATIAQLFWKSESVQYLSFISRLFVWGLTISRAWDREDVWLAWKFSQTFCQTWKFSQTFCQT